MSRNKAILTTSLIFITFLFLTVIRKIENVSQQSDDNSDEISEITSKLDEVNANVEDIQNRLNM